MSEAISGALDFGMLSRLSLRSCGLHFWIAGSTPAMTTEMVGVTRMNPALIYLRVFARNQAQVDLAPTFTQAVCERACFVDIEYRYPNAASSAKRFTNDRLADCFAADYKF